MIYSLTKVYIKHKVQTKSIFLIEGNTNTQPRECRISFRQFVLTKEFRKTRDCKKDWNTWKEKLWLKKREGEEGKWKCAFVSLEAQVESWLWGLAHPNRRLSGPIYVGLPGGMPADKGLIAAIRRWPFFARKPLKSLKTFAWLPLTTATAQKNVRLHLSSVSRLCGRYCVWWKRNVLYL